MKLFDLNYSLKNIPIPTQDNYLRKFIHQLETFITNVRWKALHFELDTNNEDDECTYGFKTSKTPPPHRDLALFENDLLNLLSSITFRESKCKFQQKLTKDVSRIKRSKNIIVKADKTNNLYEIQPSLYNKLLTENITTHYKATDYNTANSINLEAKSLAENLKLDDRIDRLAEKQAFLTIKDHKPNFPNTIKCRLINPAKTEIGKISKIHLQEINEKIRNKLQLNQWRNTMEALKWFKEIKDKDKKRFISLDIVDFYPSIKEPLLNKALLLAENHTKIDPVIKGTIKHARKSLLFGQNKTWSKKEGLFDITMGCFDGAEICELVGLYILSEITHQFPQLNFGLYRDDGLGYYQAMPNTSSNKMKKGITALFNSFGLNITIDADKKEINFLDTTLNLTTGKYAPFRKPNDTPLYIHTKSNHPRTIIKEIPHSISKRISTISDDEHTFNEHIPAYQKAIIKSGFKQKLSYINTDISTTNNENKDRKNRKRKIIWFNPPFNANVTNNIGREFLNIVNKHFPKTHKFHKIFNRNTIKLSYSCTPNIGKIISNHNATVLQATNNNNNSTNNATNKCNCKIKNQCPINNKCLESNIIYKATISTSDTSKHYIGSTSTTFKTRLGNHKQSLKNINKKDQTKLSQYYWKIKTEQNIEPTIHWSILKHSRTCSPGSTRCLLCEEEKLQIMKSNNTHSLNSRTELVTSCRHKKKNKLRSFTIPCTPRNTRKLHSNAHTLNDRPKIIKTKQSN